MYKKMFLGFLTVLALNLSASEKVDTVNVTLYVISKRPKVIITAETIFNSGIKDLNEFAKLAAIEEFRKLNKVQKVTITQSLILLEKYKKLNQEIEEYNSYFEVLRLFNKIKDVNHTDNPEVIETVLLARG